MEHVEALGGSLETIAAAKAGIAQAGGTVVVAEQGTNSMAALTKALSSIQTPQVYSAPDHVRATAGGLIHRHGTGVTYSCDSLQCESLS